MRAANNEMQLGQNAQQMAQLHKDQPRPDKADSGILSQFVSYQRVENSATEGWDLQKGSGGRVAMRIRFLPQSHQTAAAKVPRTSSSLIIACGLVASNLNLKPGECLRVRGEVAAVAKGFSLNLGKDNNNLCLHFNPRFDAHGDINTIVCNSKDAGAWGAEQRESAFPFQPGSVVEVCVSFNQTNLTIKLPDGYEFKFPNRLNLEAINYLAAGGDFKIKCVAFE
ncbi:galectin-1-like [Moschus berezovskii]|uniref:galectin-1-like n=1 Tax=Moschus berezovskii TaxID=68408 RepID=UPI00244415E0|nr:galectin-1-like [Moschus berezovskii]